MPPACLPTRLGCSDEHARGRGRPPASEGGRLLSIGEVAELLGTTTRTLRYYEELGLVSSSRLTETAQRRYGPEEIARLRRIPRAADAARAGAGRDRRAPRGLGPSRRPAGGVCRRPAAGATRRTILIEGLAILEQLRDRVPRAAGGPGELRRRARRTHRPVPRRPRAVRGKGQAEALPLSVRPQAAAPRESLPR